MLPEQSPKRALRRTTAIILVLALAPAIGVGIARFAYSLLLPDMRASLGWSYAAAGFMNAINAAGYLIGALIAAAAMRRIDRFGAILYGSLACVIALALSAATANFLLLSAARLAAGIGGAVAFVAGGVETARLSQRHRPHAAFLLSLYYVGPGLGIVMSGVVTPLLLAELGPGSWWMAWGVLAAICAVLCLVLLLARSDWAKEGETKSGVPARLMPMAIVLASYCLFSIGTIGYMTFMIAWLVDAGAGALAQSAFWSFLGFGGICAPLFWSWVFASLRGGRAIALLSALTFAATALSLFVNSRTLQFAAAFGFGSVFLAVVAATTAFVRQNLPPAAWPSGVGAMTVAFGLGQTIGPVVTGVISDASGHLALGLQCSAALLAFAAVLALFQRDLVPLAATR
jgi:predicted MFS family arabinose efflux permease